MSGFVEHLKEVLASFGPVQARRMFGGYGLYYDNVMFGLIADETLYLKVDRTTMPYFVARGLTPFRYSSKDRDAVTMSYFLAPEEVLEDPEQARVWAERAYDAALRSRAPKRAKVRNKSKKKSGR